MIVGLLIRHYKAYHGINYIPISSGEKFTSFVGANGVGKSSILEAIDFFFNDKRGWNINLKAKLAGGVSSDSTRPFVAPVFLIKKDLVSDETQKLLFQELHDFFANYKATEKNMALQNFVNHRNELTANIDVDNYYLFSIGIDYERNIFFHNFRKGLYDQSLSDVDNTKISDDDEGNINKLLKEKYSDIFKFLSQHYLYIYFPVEASTEEITRIENQEMQKLMNNDVKQAIKISISQEKLDSINKSLDQFVDGINDRLSGYNYKNKGQRKNIIMQDLTDLIIEVYFSKRVLTKKKNLKGTDVDIMAHTLSSGEKRKALIDLAYALLSDETNQTEKEIVIGIDEPEASLHTSVCFEQFDRLRFISRKHQILLTTHWYGFLPIIGDGVSHFMNIKDESLSIDSYNLGNYRERIKKDRHDSKNTIPGDYYLKSINDLVQSIFYSIQSGYKWIICEGTSEKIYFDYFFKEEISNNKLIILPVGGGNEVAQLYKHLYLPIDSSKNLGNIKGRIFCLVDTDKTNHFGSSIEHCSIPSIIQIQRLLNDANSDTQLKDTKDITPDVPTTIENSLDPNIFKMALDNLSPGLISMEIHDSRNTDYIHGLNLRSTEAIKIDNFFNENEGRNKIFFAQEYVKISNEKDISNSINIKWIDTIKTFLFNS